MTHQNPPKSEQVSEPLLAHHEAGHAVAACLLGLPFRYVTIDPATGPPGGRQFSGYVFIATREVPVESAPVRWQRVLSEIVFHYSGAASEHVCGGVPMDAITGVGADYRKAYTLFTEHFGFAFAPEETWAVLRLLKQKAVELVRTHRREVERVARALMVVKILTGDEVRAVAQGRDWQTA